jgi:hypothetical protein
MALQQLASTLFAVALGAAFIAPAAAEQVFEDVSTGRIAPLPTPTGISVYDAYFYGGCYGATGSFNGSGSLGHGNGHGSGHGQHSMPGTINGERFYPFDPRSTSMHGFDGHGHHCGNRTAGPGYFPSPTPHRVPGPGPVQPPYSVPSPRSY